MSRYNKVLWREGMLLSPHHFQQMDNYIEDVFGFRLQSLFSHDWGITGLEIDRDGLANGTFTLLRCSGVLPDGLPLSIPSPDKAPDSRTIEDHFALTMETLDVYLATPVKRTDSANYSFQGDGKGARATRYVAEVARLCDENTNDNEREIEIARKNLRILFADESVEDYTTLKIAELKRTAAGLVTLNEAYIPPCLSISASDPLLDILRRLLEILMTKSSELSGQRGQRTRGLADFTTAEAANFWLLHTVNSFIPALAHFYNMRVGHPEPLFLALSQLAGELMTFVTGRHPRDLPKYVHTDLARVFRSLDDTIEELLSIAIPRNYFPIPLEKVRESLMAGRITDDSLLESAQFYLAATAELPENQLIEQIPQRAKIASRDQIEPLIGRALRGVALNHTPVPPRPLPVRLGYHYFRLENRGDFWDAIRGSRTVAIYIPGVPGLKLEFYAVRETSG
ncbi:MAG: type VI secretion system baseplate subunit TssK [Acidobacteria bacterium]|nr:type VI secretion system baseplate subunit TssK [Acidobacteriota bacterium]MBI3655374.1 type VI secretion system baseplate subunit TssK [Acidobacteriota bacterium]